MNTREITEVLEKLRTGKRKVKISVNHDGSGEDRFIVFIDSLKLETPGDMGIVNSK